MKIIHVKDKKNGTTYHRYKINLPKKEVESSGLLGEELRIKFVKEKIIIEKDKRAKIDNTS